MADQPKRTSTGSRSAAHLLNIKKPSEVKKRLKLAFQRVPAKVHFVKHQETLHISVALVDISEGGAGFFLSRMVSKGGLVEFEITDPRPMKVKGLVAWCVPMNSGMHVLKHPFRAGIQFVFDSEEERKKVAAFIQQLMTDDSVHWPTSAASVAGVGMIPAEPKEAAAQTVSSGEKVIGAPAVAEEIPAAGTATPPVEQASSETPAANAAEDTEKKAA